MTASQRIAINTLATYGRTILGIALGLFSGRWVYQALGEIDYGLMGVVGAAIIFITFLNGITSSSCARFFAFSIGKGDANETNRWFNTALSVHTILPTFLLLAGYPAGIWVIKHFFNIPPERLGTALWVFRLSLVSAFTSMCFTPFFGMFIAKQRIYEMSIWGIVQTCCLFGLAYSLVWYKGDAWLLYSAGTVGISVMIGIGQVLRAHFIFPECRIHLSRWWNRSYIQKLFSFAGWQLFGGLGNLIRGSGTAILLNKYFPPSSFQGVNASYGIGGTVSGYTQTLASALLGAFTPEITASEGRGNREQMLLHANRASKFGTWLILLFAIPLLLEIDYVLALWLKKPPELAGMFCMLILTQFIIDRLTTGHMIAVSAVGKIAGYQVMIGGFLILTLPIAWLFLACGFSAISVGWAFIFTTTMQSVGRVVWAKYLVGLSPLKWVKEVFLPCFLICVAGGGIGKATQFLFATPSFYRLVVVGMITFISSILLGWLVVLSHSEKNFFISNLSRLVQYTRKESSI